MTKDKVRLCWTCGKRPAYNRGSYCGPCASKRTIAGNAKREKKQQDLAVSLVRVDNFLEAISRMTLELEVASSQETRRYLRTVIDREASNLGLLATNIIRAQIK